MIAKCFECGETIEANELDELADTFVAHGEAHHHWTFSEAAIRSYACNHAEAVIRLSGEVERRVAIGGITVHSVDRSRIGDWRALFEHTGFAGNPDWASCFCFEPHKPRGVDDPERPWRVTCATMVDRLTSGRTTGYLAYAGKEPAGWVNASLRSEYTIFQVDDASGIDPCAVVGVSCFVIAPPFRRHGVASALLDRVIGDAHTRGAAWIEAYPHNRPEPGDPGHFRGLRSMYEARGFEPIVVRDRYTVMRRRAPVSAGS